MFYLVEIRIDEKLLFLDKDLVWKLEGNNGLYHLNDKDYSMFILPLLEYNFLDIKDKIPDQYFESLPIIPLLKFPFDNKMKYWAELALQWIDDGDYGTDLRLWAKNVDTQHWMPQKLKHKFWKSLGLRSYTYLPFPDLNNKSDS